MPHGGKLSVSTCNISMDHIKAAKRPPMSSGEYVLLTVTDTGHGMDEATKAHIFEPFFTTKEIGQGTGLGLATVYGVVKQSGGFIWVVSSPGKGTSFEIYLPQTAETGVTREGKAKTPEILQGSETVLVVEDEAGVRDLACQFLRVKGYTVLEARDGQEAVEIAARYEGVIHLLLSDMVMPQMNGAELARHMLKARPGIRVAFVSGYSEFARGDMGKGFPEAPILQKPFSPISLVKLVREALSAKVPEQAPNPKEFSVA
jgi:CheY-like chemotaxis protein